jgi:hypothetical protein
VRHAAVQLLGAACMVSLCAACTTGHSTPGPTPIPITPIPTAQQLVSAYASTLAHDRFRFDLKSSVSEEIGTLDAAHDALDLTTPGSAQLEVRHLGSHEWARNAIDLDPNPGLSGSPEDSPVWLITPGAHGDVMSQLPREFPLVASLTGLDQSGTSPVRVLGAADVKGAATVGYQWNAILPAAVGSQAKIPSGREAQIQMRLDSRGRVAELRVGTAPIAASFPAPAPSGSVAPPPETESSDVTLTLYDFDNTPPITAPPNPVTAAQLNAQQ